MAGVPFDAEILTFRLTEQALPHCRLGEHVETHDWQVIGRHRAMLEGNADTFPCRNLCNRLPELEKARKELLEGFVHWVVAPRMRLQFDDCSWKTSNGFHADMRGDFDGAQES